MSVSHEGGFDKSGIFGYRTTSNSVNSINVVRCHSNRVELLFHKAISNDFVHPPVCFSNSVIIVNINGAITQYTLGGAETFSSVALSTNALCRKVGKWDSKTIYLVAAFYKGNPPKRTLSYKAIWFEIDGAKAVYKGEKDVRQPITVIRRNDELLIIGEDYVDIVAAPR